MLFKTPIHFPPDIVFVGRISYEPGEINPNIGVGAVGVNMHTESVNLRAQSITGDPSDRVTLEGGRITGVEKAFFESRLKGRRYTLTGTSRGPMIVVWKDATPDNEKSFEGFFEEISCFIEGVSCLTQIGPIVMN